MDTFYLEASWIGYGLIAVTIGFAFVAFFVYFLTPPSTPLAPVNTNPTGTFDQMMTTTAFGADYRPSLNALDIKTKEQCQGSVTGVSHCTWDQAPRCDPFYTGPTCQHVMHPTDALPTSATSGVVYKKVSGTNPEIFAQCRQDPVCKGVSIDSPTEGTLYRSLATSSTFKPTNFFVKKGVQTSPDQVLGRDPNGNLVITRTDTTYHGFLPQQNQGTLKYSLNEDLSNPLTCSSKCPTTGPFYYTGMSF